MQISRVFDSLCDRFMAFYAYIHGILGFEGIVLCRSGFKYYPIRDMSTTYEKEIYSSVFKWTPSFFLYSF